MQCQVLQEQMSSQLCNSYNNNFKKTLYNVKKKKKKRAHSATHYNIF